MIPTTFDVPLKTHNELNGIIHKLRYFYNVDPLDYVVPSSFYDMQGNKKTLVVWDTFLYQSGNNVVENAWFQLTFWKHFVFPSSYSMRSVYDGQGTYFCPTTWRVLGIYFGDENHQDRWVELGTNNLSESIYCNSSYSSGRCSDTKTSARSCLIRKSTKEDSSI